MHIHISIKYIKNKEYKQSIKEQINYSIKYKYKQ